MTLWYTKMRSAESNPATVNSQDDGKCASQVVAEIIFFSFAKRAWICSVTSVLMRPLISTLSPCAKIDVFLQSSDFFFLFFLYKPPLLQDCSPCFPMAYWFPALETCSFLSQVLLVIPGLWYLLVDTPVLWSVKAGHTVNMPMFNLKESLSPWRWEMESHLVTRTWLSVHWDV